MASILIIDDVPAVLLSLRLVLQGGGHRITVAEHGARGLALLERESFDLVITDIWMPGPDGAEIIRAGRVLSPRTRFLAITGGDPNGGARTPPRERPSDDPPRERPSDDPPRERRFDDPPEERRFGADAVLLKPFEKDALLNAIAALLEPVA